MIRRLLLPAVAAVPIYVYLPDVWTTPGHLPDYSWPSLGELFFGAFWNVIGILIACVPLSQMLQRVSLPAPIALILLVLGCVVIASAVILLVTLTFWALGGGEATGALSDVLAFALHLGSLMGGTLGLIWGLLNFDLLTRQGMTRA